jgi:hypothetical protein
MRARTTSLVPLALALVGCVFGWRGEAELVGDHDLAGIRTIRIDLPSTPMTIDACEPLAPGACPERLRYVMRVLATGGSEADARAHATKPALVFETDGALGRLQADIPLAVRGLVDLELDAMELPADRDLDLHMGLGDIDVHGVRGAITIDVDRGHVVVDGGDAGIAVRLGVGDIEVHTAGEVDLDTRSGNVDIVQDGGARRVFVDADGDVSVELASSDDLELDLVAGGSISVTTTSVVALADHELVRTVGAGTIRVEIRAQGDIVLTERE